MTKAEDREPDESSIDASESPAVDLDDIDTDVSPADDDSDDAAAPTEAAKKPKHGLTHQLYTGELSYDFIGRRRLWYIISAILILVSGVAYGVRGLNLGIEFTGGAEFSVTAEPSDETISKVRTAVTDLGLPDMASVSVQKVGQNMVRVQTRSLEVDEIPQVQQAIADATDVKNTEVAYSLIGASWGDQITNRGLIALAVFLALVSLLIWVYFRELKMAVAALVALAHDLVITIGVFALVGFSFTPASLIGMLTILGYSLYDTVVVFDKVRENTAGLKHTRLTYSQAANNAVNQVFVRSVNTTIIGILPVAALLFTGVFVLGTGPLKDVGLVLFVGMIAGAYSSIFIATPLLAQMKEQEPAMVAQRRRVERRAERDAARVSVTVRTGSGNGSNSGAIDNETTRSKKS